MNIHKNSATCSVDIPSFEDAARAGDARRKFADRLAKEVPTRMTFQGVSRTETITLPPLAAAALQQVLACISAGRGVCVVPQDSEIDEAALLAGLDPMEFLESLTQLGLPMRLDQGQVFISTAVLGQCLAVIHGEQPEESSNPASGAQGSGSGSGNVTGKGSGSTTNWSLARDLLTHRQWHFSERLVRDLQKAGNRIPPDTYALEYYFGRRPLIGRRPPSWPPLPHRVE
jgi:hypothetical protein